MMALLMLLQEQWRKEGFGEAAYHNVTTLHPVALVATTLLGLAVLVVPRRYASWPLILLAGFVPPAQRVIIATLDFNLMRLLLLAGSLRIFLRAEHVGVRWGRLDKLVLAWALVGTAAYVVLFASFSQLIFKVGELYDVLGLYFYFRCTIRGWGDVSLLVKMIAVIVLPASVMFVEESLTGRNPFSFFGGVREFTAIREGRLRCQGPFVHAILAGTYYAAWIPLFMTFLWTQGSRILAFFAIVASLVIVVTTASSTPVVGVMAAGCAWFFWPMRHQMRLVRWSLVGTLFALHMVMKAPVWHLISRISFSKGSTSYHRFRLIDNFINHANEWALIGIKDTGRWGHSMYDLTNQFVREGVRGGFIAMVLYILVVAEGFAIAGRLWRRYEGYPRYQYLAWGLGGCLFTHVVMFFSISISHSQQNMAGFFIVIAALGSLEFVRPPSRSKRRPPRIAGAAEADGLPDDAGPRSIADRASVPTFVQ